jgi:hypothetical protein
MILIIVDIILQKIIEDLVQNKKISKIAVKDFPPITEIKQALGPHIKLGAELFKDADPTSMEFCCRIECIKENPSYVNKTLLEDGRIICEVKELELNAVLLPKIKEEMEKMKAEEERIKEAVENQTDSDFVCVS